MTNSILNSANLDINSLIADVQGYLLIKDFNSMFLSGNQIAAKEFGVRDANYLYGLTDMTISHSLSDIGHFFINLDTGLIRDSENLNGIYAFPFHGVVHPFNFKKSFLKDQSGNNVAIYSHAEE